MNEAWAADEVWGVDIVWPTNNTNISVHDYLLQTRGPKTLPLQVVVPITVLYSAIFVSGLVGNIVICTVIITNPSLHTNTNYYLFSLAVSDLTLLLLGLPHDLSDFWQQYPWRLGLLFCKLRALVSEMSSYTSVLTIVAFSLERYLAICHPLLSYSMSGLARVVRIIAILWIISFFGALPFAVYTKVNYVNYPPESDIILEESAFCGMLKENVPSNLPIYEASFVIFFCVPLGVLLLLYTLIGLEIRSTGLHESINGTVHGETKKMQSRKSIIRMLVAVVVTFFLSWAPYHAQRLHYMYGLGSAYFYQINEWLYYITGCFYYLSSTVNPVLYNLMSAKYREGFRRTFCGWHRDRRFSALPSSVREPPNKERSSTSDHGENWSQRGSRDVVVTITPDKGGATVTTETCHWPRTRLRVTMDSERMGDAQGSICVEMETCL